MAVTLEIISGVGQVQVIQQILLMSSGTGMGLCMQQTALNGGPYAPSDNGLFFFDQFQARPFAAIGAIVANAISVRGVYFVGGPPPGAFTAPAILSILASPLAAGTQL